MLKKFFAMLLMLLMIFNGVYVSSECSNFSEYNVDEHQDQYLISRADCLTFIMIAIGSFPYLHESYGGIPYEEYYNEWSVCDFDSVIVGEEIANKNINDFYSGALFQKFPECVDIAIKYAKIANGEYVVDASENIVYFNMNGKVTLEQCLAFMVRCFAEDRYQEKSLDDIFRIAKEKSLILETDEFFDKPQKFLTLSEFCMILERFLNQPKGVYHCEGYYTLYNFNSDTSETYYDNLAGKYGEDFIEWLLSYDGTPQWDFDNKYTYMSRQGLRNAEKGKIYLDNIKIFSDVSEFTINSFSIIHNAENHREYIMLLYGTYRNPYENKIELPNVLQNNVYLNQHTFLDNYYGEPKEDGSYDFILSYYLKNNVDNVIITYGNRDSGSKDKKNTYVLILDK